MSNTYTHCLCFGSCLRIVYRFFEKRRVANLTAVSLCRLCAGAENAKLTDRRWLSTELPRMLASQWSDRPGEEGLSWKAFGAQPRTCSNFTSCGITLEIHKHFTLD
jgi:hypothetical protein